MAVWLLVGDCIIAQEKFIPLAVPAPPPPGGMYILVPEAMGWVTCFGLLECEWMWICLSKLRAKHTWCIGLTLCALIASEPWVPESGCAFCLEKALCKCRRIRSLPFPPAAFSRPATAHLQTQEWEIKKCWQFHTSLTGESPRTKEPQ